METEKKRGRPKGSVASKTREVIIQVKLFPEEAEAYQAAADKLGLVRSAWMRMELNKAAGGTNR
jgi:hypothetical protein